MAQTNSPIMDFFGSFCHNRRRPSGGGAITAGK
jgi:hypothetical protein